MNTTWYWRIRHMRRGMRELRFAATCWWLSQQVDFLEWRRRLDAAMPRPQPVPVPVRPARGIRKNLHTR